MPENSNMGVFVVKKFIFDVKIAKNMFVLL